jgi:hypothetical protein
MPSQPPRQNRDEVDDTIDPTNDVDEALFETFPASDAPGYTGGAATPDGNAYTAEDAERARRRAEEGDDDAA